MQVHALLASDDRPESCFEKVLRAKRQYEYDPTLVPRLSVRALPGVPALRLFRSGLVTGPGPRRWTKSPPSCP